MAGSGVERARSCAAAVLLVVAFTGLSPAYAAAETTLAVSAGLDGIAKPGRWTMVRVTVHAQADPAGGELTAEWGATSLKRPVDVPAGGTQQFEFYLQTMEVGGAVSVTLTSGGATIARGRAALRVLRPEDPVTICIGDPIDAAACTAAPPVDALPRSLRGYDAADYLVWNAAAASSMAPEQRIALAQWRALRALDERGSLAAAERPRSVIPALARKSRTGTHIHAAMALYLVVVCGAIGTMAGRRFRAPALLGAVAALAVTGAAAATAAGRSGPATTIVVHHATLVQQMGNAPGSIVTMQGAAEYPAFDSYDLHALADDAALEATRRQGTAEVYRLDANGYPVLPGTFGLGERQPFTLYAVSEAQPLSLERRGDVVVISNRSPEPLRACRFSDGSAAGDLEPGATISTHARDTIDPVISCDLVEPPVRFAERHRGVRTLGRAVLAAYLQPQDGAAE